MSFNNPTSLPDKVTQVQAEAGTDTAELMWTAQRVQQAIAALSPATLPLLVSQVQAEAGTDTAELMWSALRVAQAIAALNNFQAADRTKLDGIESLATIDQTNAEIETAYNAQVTAMSQAQAEAGTNTAIQRVTALRLAQAITALAPAAYTVTTVNPAGDTANWQIATNSKSYYKLYVKLIPTASGTMEWGIRINNASGSVYAWVYQDDGVRRASTSDTNVELVNSGTAQQNYFGVIEIFNKGDGTTIIFNGGDMQNNETVENSAVGIGVFKTTGAITSINFIENNGSAQIDTTSEVIMLEGST